MRTGSLFMKMSTKQIFSLFIIALGHHLIPLFFFSKIFWLKTTQYHGFINTALRQLRPYFISHDCKEIFILILWQKTWLLIFNNKFIAPTYSVPKHCQPCMSLYDLHAQNHGFIHWLSMLLIRTLPCDNENELENQW